MLATLRVPRFRAVLIRLSLSVPVLGRLLTGAGLASDRWLSGGLLADLKNLYADAELPGIERWTL